jgi:hypothetical protein
MDQVADAEEGGAMKKVLNWFHVAMLGTGRVIASSAATMAANQQDHQVQVVQQHPHQS